LQFNSKQIFWHARSKKHQDISRLAVQVFGHRPSTYTYRLFVLLKIGADRCVSFPPLRCLLRRRTIRHAPKPVNTFCEKNRHFRKQNLQTFDL
ncbi:hypothetical protein, partial [Chromobacterium haemolyticum]|uniref:hypothetical protein n=1 Tax=Chromobacterium haemolyticum TaxID=394935 RepID=UPI001C388D8A